MSGILLRPTDQLPPWSLVIPRPATEFRYHVKYRVQNKSPLVRIPSQTNPLYALILFLEEPF
jgi:hypothetical protein